MPRVKEAFFFPFRDQRWPSKLLIGGLVGLVVEFLFVLGSYLSVQEVSLSVAPIALAANFPAFGYAFFAFKAALDGKEEMPSWRRWAGFTGTGFFLSLLGLGYGLIPFLLILLGFELLVQGGALLFTGTAMIVSGISAGLLVGFFLPMRFARYARGGKVEAVFSFKPLWSRIDAVLGEYLVAYLLCIASWLLVGIAASLPIFGAVVWPFLAFYLMLVFARLFGEVCAPALTEQPTPPV